MRLQINKFAFILVCAGLGALGYFAAGWVSSRSASVESTRYFERPRVGASSDSRPDLADTSVSAGSEQKEELSLLSSSLSPGFVEFLYTKRIQAELTSTDIEMIETRLLAELPPHGGDKHQDPRESEVAARYALLRALHKAHLGSGIDESFVPELAALYKKLIQSSEYSLYLKAQALRNLAVVGIGADELVRDQYLQGIDPRIHRLAAMDEVQDLVTEE